MTFNDRGGEVFRQLEMEARKLIADLWFSNPVVDLVYSMIKFPEKVGMLAKVITVLSKLALGITISY